MDLKKFQGRVALQMIRKWAERNGIEILNVAGPRASKDPLIYRETVELLCSVLGFYPPLDVAPVFVTEPVSGFQPGCEPIAASV